MENRLANQQLTAKGLGVLAACVVLTLEEIILNREVFLEHKELPVEGVPTKNTVNTFKKYRQIAQDGLFNLRLNDRVIEEENTQIVNMLTWVELCIEHLSNASSNDEYKEPLCYESSDLRK